MPRGANLTLTHQTILGLLFMQRYRFLTIDQFARAADLNRSTAADQLLHLERHDVLNHFGNTGLAGHGKTPKVYALSPKGFALLARESDMPPELLGNYQEVKTTAHWSPQMHHRLATVDLLIAAEVAVRARAHLTIVKTFLEYRQRRMNNHIARETADFVAEEETSENRIIPDASIILGHRGSGQRRLLFLETDMCTERIVTKFSNDRRLTVLHKIEQYERYLTGGRFAQTYAAYGTFGYFTLLFVTKSSVRIGNIRHELRHLPSDLSDYFRFTTYEQAMRDFLGPIWQARSVADTTSYPLVRESRPA
jgi:hypothetical protein